MKARFISSGDAPLLEGYLNLPTEILQQEIAERIDPCSLGKLSLASRGFFNEMKSASYWRNKIISAGCPPKAIDEVVRLGLIHDYRKLYCHFLKSKNEKYFPEKIQTPWELLCLSGEFPVISSIIEKTIPCEIPRGQQQRALFIIAFSGNAAAIKAAITKFGMNPSINKLKMLFYAALSRSVEAAIQALDELGVDIKSTDHEGCNALHHTAFSGNVDAINAVVALGVEPILVVNHDLKIWAKDFIKNTDISPSRIGVSVLHYAALSCRAEAVRAVAKLGVDPLIFANGGLNALHYAANSGDAETILAIGKLVDPNIHDCHGYNALYYAAESGNGEAFKAVIELGVDLTIRDQTGKNALQYALDTGSVDAVRLVIERGVDDLHNQHFGRFVSKAYDAFETEPEKMLFIRRLCFEQNIEVTNIITELSGWKDGEKIIEAFQGLSAEKIPPTGIPYKPSANPPLQRDTNISPTFTPEFIERNFVQQYATKRRGLKNHAPM